MLRLHLLQGPAALLLHVPLHELPLVIRHEDKVVIVMSCNQTHLNNVRLRTRLSYVRILTALKR